MGHLTGNDPKSTASSASLAGTTHDLDLKTPYYTATVPIWLDLITTPSEWAHSFLSPEAKEVLEVLGGLIVVFAIPTTASSTETKELIREVGNVVKRGLGGWAWDGVGLGIGVGEVAHLDDLDVWDEACGNAGLEFVHLAPSAAAAAPDAKNEYGEKMGIARVLEAIESNEWDSLAGDMSPLGDSENEDELELDLENMDFGFDKEDFVGLRAAIWEARMERVWDGDGDGKGETADKSNSEDVPSADEVGDKDEVDDKNEGGDKGDKDEVGDELGDEDVQKVEEMMRKLLAVKDMSAGLPEDQRKRMAAKAVGEVMREL
ncbi:Increased recombination centers protein 6 [Cytospora mali]|uniref:Increased recombination centers protein 6 n=1 Tax=Cytospora mali TaxID=578113 RepID=A0A194VIQ9_CYTMA|nr:Increased recombination centers protein 6 [Valsa mali]